GAISIVGPAITSPLGLRRCPDGAQQQQTPSAQPAAPTVAIASVAFGGSANRLAPTQSATVAATITNLPSGGNVDFDIENAGGAHGDASVSAGARLSTSGNVTVLAGSGQTA